MIFGSLENESWCRYTLSIFRPDSFYIYFTKSKILYLKKFYFILTGLHCNKPSYNPWVPTSDQIQKLKVLFSDLFVLPQKKVLTRPVKAVKALVKPVFEVPWRSAKIKIYLFIYLCIYLFIYLFIYSFYDKKIKSLKSQCLHHQHRYTTAFSQWIIEV